MKQSNQLWILSNMQWLRSLLNVTRKSQLQCQHSGSRMLSVQSNPFQGFVAIKAKQIDSLLWTFIKPSLSPARFELCSTLNKSEGPLWLHDEIHMLAVDTWYNTIWGKPDNVTGSSNLALPLCMIERQGKMESHAMLQGPHKTRLRHPAGATPFVLWI